ncbi:hypothetical protein UUC_12296 [Rhodanobacter denitrificans]|nr:hypothetical protein UUC_12296 [Rhodanobacter denitrificans]
MRPQLFAADHAADAVPVACESIASMRPQLFAADHQCADASHHRRDVASMRPQLFAADHIASMPIAWKSRMLQ